MSSPVSVRFSPVQAKILDAYIALSMESGVGNVTLQQVAKKSKVAFGTVRYHFAGEGKLDLTQATALYVVQSAYALIDGKNAAAQSIPGSNGLAVYIEAMFEWVEKEPEKASFLICFYYLCTTSVSLPIQNKLFLERARGRISTLLYESIGKKITRADIDVPNMALKIHALLTGACVVAMTEKKKESLRTQKALVLDSLKDWLDWS